MQPTIPGENSDGDGAIVEKTLRFVAERTWRVTGIDFFRDLVTFLGDTLNVAYAFCDTIDPSDDKKVQTPALYSHGHMSENFSYDLQNTPCENVIGQTLCCYVDKVQKQFPKDQLLVDLNVESYVGAPLWSADGASLGLVAIMDDKPLRNPDLARTVLQIVAIRAGAELERMQVLDRLQLSEQLLQNVINAVPAMINAKDRESRYQLMNRYQAENYGTTPEDAIGRDAGDLIGESYGKYTAGLDKKVFATGQALLNFEETWTDLDGIRRNLLTTKAPIHNAAGAVVNVVTVSVDVTERKRAEEERVAALAEAEQANRAKSEFLATMSHEFRTPLNAILGFSTIMCNELFGPLGSKNYSEYAVCIHDSGQHLLALIDDILDISAIEAGKRALDKEMIAVKRLLDECVKNVEGAFRDRPIRITVEVPDGLPDLYTDKRSAVQIVQNLLSNAVKFTDLLGSIVVTAEASDRGLSIRVNDSGIGIADDQLSKITDPFFQASPSPHVSHKGMGLGLAIVKSLIDAHGGDLAIESHVGKGTMVAVTFPFPDAFS